MDPTVENRLLAVLDDARASAIEERSSGLIVFFDSHVRRDRAAGAVARAFPPDEVLIAPFDVPDEDWASRSQAGLRAVRVGRLVVAPPWDRTAATDETTLEIVVKPSMGFGTGHHPTTRLCLAALQRLKLKGLSVLDVGTGSAVLAIAARLLGAGPVIAIEDDPDALASARENLALNGLQDLQGAIELRLADFRATTDLRAAIVVANLTGATLVASARELTRAVEDAGFLVISGFMADEEAAVLPAFRPAARLDWCDREDGWVCATFVV